MPLNKTQTHWREKRFGTKSPTKVDMPLNNNKTQPWVLDVISFKMVTKLDFIVILSLKLKFFKDCIC